MDALTRREKIISGENLEPLTREEYFLKEYGGGSGGGTTVVANPSGTASEDLTKLQVGNDIYGIPSGGGTEKFVVTFTYDENDSSYSCDKTFAEIKTAYNSNKIIEGMAENASFYPSIGVRYFSDEEVELIAFSFLEVTAENDKNAIIRTAIAVLNDDSVEVDAKMVVSSV